MILRDDIALHRKFLVAGQLIGEPGGAARALAFWVAAVGYARKFQTDGIIGDEFLSTYSLEKSHELIVKSLCSKRVKLLHRSTFGARTTYRIHDFEQHNGISPKLKRARELAAERKRRQRAKEAVENSQCHAVTHPVTLRDISVTRARARKDKEKEKEVRTEVQRPDGRGSPATDPEPESPETPQHRDQLSREPADDQNYAVLVRLTHAVLDQQPRVETTADLAEAVKCEAATHLIAYPPDVLERAIRSATVQRQLPTAGPLSALVDRVQSAIATQTLPQTLTAMRRAARSAS